VGGALTPLLPFHHPAPDELVLKVSTRVTPVQHSAVSDCYMSTLLLHSYYTLTPYLLWWTALSWLGGWQCGKHIFYWALLSQPPPVKISKTNHKQL